jgi:hypothetical protein
MRGGGRGQGFVPASRRERADAELLSPPDNRVRAQSIDPCAGDDQRDHGKRAEQRHVDSRLGRRFPQRLIHRLKVPDRLILVDRPDGRLHGRNHRGRFHRGPHDECEERRLLVWQRLVRMLLARHKDLRDWLEESATVPHVVDDADDRQPVLPILVVVQAQPFADRLSARPQLSCHRFVDDRDGGAAGGVPFLEVASAAIGMPMALKKLPLTTSNPAG